MAFFEWLRGHGWTAITLDDIARAKSGARPLPERAILITFDDGFRSLYTRVYPLLMAYRIPVVASLICGFLDAPADSATPVSVNPGVGRRAVAALATSSHGQQAREMAGSGLVEFASHSYDLHHGELGNPLGSQFPAAAARRLEPVRGV